MIDPQQEPLPEHEPPSPWINDAGHPDAFKEDKEYLAKYKLPPIEKPENN